MLTWWVKVISRTSLVVVNFKKAVFGGINHPNSNLTHQKKNQEFKEINFEKMSLKFFLK